MNNWDRVRNLLKDLEWEADLRYDCLMQVLQEEFGERETQRLYAKAGKRYVAIHSSAKAETQSPNTQAQRKNKLHKQDYWTDN